MKNTFLKEISEIELENKIKLHEMWVNSAHKEGKQLQLLCCKIKNINFSKYSKLYRDIKIEHSIIEDSSFKSCEFIGCSFKNTGLKGVIQ